MREVVVVVVAHRIIESTQVPRAGIWDFLDSIGTCIWTWTCLDYGLLKVFVAFYTMISTVCQYNVAVLCNCYSLRSIYLASRGINKGEERTKLIKHLKKQEVIR